MWDSTFFIQLITSMLSSVAYSVIFRLRARYLPWAAIGGGLTFFMYYVILQAFSSVFAAAFFGSALMAIFSEFCARVKQAPAVIFILPCAIPIVPGGSLYRAMYYLISKNTSLAAQYFGETLAVAGGIAGGIAIVSLLVHLINAGTRQLQERK